jgi:GntR family transcriptional regulator
MAEPLYKQIADDLRIKIENGELPHGSQLPTESKLMEEYDASRNTVRDAIKQLTTRGLVEPRPGQGTFVVDEINPFVSTLTSDDPSRGDEDVYIAEVQEGGREPTVSRPRVEIQEASEVVADALRINPSDTVVIRHQERFIDGIPWSLQTSFYPMTLAENAVKLLMASNIQRGAVAYLASEFGIKQVGYRDSIAVRAPDDTEATFFKLPGDGRIQVFEIFRIGFAQDSSRIRLTITVYPADRNRFLINVGEVPGARRLN